MPNDPMNNSKRVGDASRAAIMIGVVMAFCLIGLSHEKSYLASSEEMSIEAGAGFDQHEKLEKDLNAAPLYRKIAFVTLFAVGAYCLLTTSRGATLKFGPAMILMAFCLTLVMASFLWSIEPEKTGRELVRIVVYAGLAFAMAMRFRPREIVLILALMASASVVVACGAEILTGSFRPWRSGYRLHGTLHTNVLASHAMVTILAAFAFLRDSRRRWLIATVLLAMLLVILLTKTRGAIVTSTAGVCAIYLAGRPFRSSVLAASLLGVSLSAAALLVVVAGHGIQSRVQETLALGRSEGVATLTGRLPLWKTLWRESRDRRWLGYGYGAFFTTERMQQLEEELQWYPGHAHSAYLQTVLDIGLVGAALMLALIVANLRRAYRLVRRTGDPAYRFIFGLLAAGFVDGLVEVSFVYPRGLGLFVAMAMFSLAVAHPALVQSHHRAVAPNRRTILGTRKVATI